MAADDLEVPPICAAIRAARETAGLTQRELAERLTESQEQVSNWELRREPRLSTVARLEEAIDSGRRRGWLLRQAGYVEDASTLEEMIDSDPRLDPRARGILRAFLAPVTGG